MLLAVRESVFPEQTGELLPATGDAGGGLTVTLAVPAGPVQPLAAAVTEYVPDALVPAATITGFCNVDVKLLGPVQE